MKVALYARVSKPPKGEKVDDQRRDQNPEVQFRELREWCQRNKHTVVVEYVDRLSGKNTNRPQLQKLMHDVTTGLTDVDVVLVWRLDRFGRSAQDLHNLVAELSAAKVGFVSQQENIELSTTGGKAFFGMLAVFAEMERNIISERTKAGLAYARSQGRLPGRKIDPHKGPSRTTIWRRARAKAA